MSYRDNGCLWHSCYKRLSSLVLSITLFLACGIHNVYAQDYEIALILEPQNKIHQQVQVSLKKRLNQDLVNDYRITLIDTTGTKTPSLTRSYDLAISVGSRSTIWATKNNHSPLLAVMVPSKRYKALAKNIKNRDGWFSAIVIEQPITRYFHLIKAALPNINHIDSIFGAHSREHIGNMLLQADHHGFKLHTKILKNTETVIDALRSIMIEGHSVLLTLPDPDVINKMTIRSVLLHSYHKNTPVIGFSKNYVYAGAVAAVFTTPAQFGEEAAVTSIKLLNKNKKYTNQIIYPARYEIEINQRVAKSMNLIMPSLAEIRTKMQLLEGDD